MPRPANLAKQQEILKLRAQGFRVRQISRMTKSSPSTVSRILRQDVNRDTLAQLKDRLEVVEDKILALEPVLRQIALALGHIDTRYKQMVLDELWKWPSLYFRVEHDKNRL